MMYDRFSGDDDDDFISISSSYALLKMNIPSRVTHAALMPM
jgi:hypothetical protein